jgi:hypothetical protein
LVVVVFVMKVRMKEREYESQICVCALFMVLPPAERKYFGGSARTKNDTHLGIVIKVVPRILDPVSIIPTRRVVSF